MIFAALLLISGSGAYAYTEGIFDDILELNEDENEEIKEEEEPVIEESDITALISVNTNLGTNFYSMEEVDNGKINHRERRRIGKMKCLLGQKLVVQYPDLRSQRKKKSPQQHSPLVKGLLSSDLERQVCKLNVRNLYQIQQR